MVPASSGLGNHLSEMLDWCRARVPEGDWAQHAYCEKRGGGRIPTDNAPLRLGILLQPYDSVLFGEILDPHN